MKKIIVIMFLVAIALIIASSCMFLHYYNDTSSKQIVDMSKIVIQAMLTGSVTFCGLFVTVYSQEYHNKKQKEFDLCPCIIVKDTKSISTIRDISSIRDTEKVVICCEDDKVRIVELIICNCKNNYCLNLVLLSKSGDYDLGTITDKELKINIALKNTQGYIEFRFEDVYGIKYTQTINYVMRDNTTTVFTANQPRRREL